MRANSLNRLAGVPPDVAEALESLRSAWEKAVTDAQSSGQRAQESFELAVQGSPPVQAAMRRYGVLIETSARMLRKLQIPMAQVEALLPGGERQPVLWLLSSAVVLLCARDDRVMLLEPPYSLLGAEPPERAHARYAPPNATSLRVYSWLDSVWPGFFARHRGDLLGPLQSPSVLMGCIAEAAADCLTVRETAELERLWRELESRECADASNLTYTLHDRMCWRAQYQGLDLELFRAQLGPTMQAELKRVEIERSEVEERAIREGGGGY